MGLGAWAGFGGKTPTGKGIKAVERLSVGRWTFFSRQR